MDGLHGYIVTMMTVTDFFVLMGMHDKMNVYCFQVDKRKEKRELYIAYHRDNIIVRDCSVYNQSRNEKKHRRRVELRKTNTKQQNNRIRDSFFKYILRLTT